MGLPKWRTSMWTSRCTSTPLLAHWRMQSTWRKTGFHCQRNPRRHLTIQVIGITACLHEAPFNTRTIWRNTAQNIFTNKMEGSGRLWRRTPNTSRSSPWSMALCCLLPPTDTETQWCNLRPDRETRDPYQHLSLPSSRFLTLFFSSPFLASFSVWCCSVEGHLFSHSFPESGKKERRKSLAFLIFHAPEAQAGPCIHVACSQATSEHDDSTLVLRENHTASIFYQQKALKWLELPWRWQWSFCGSGESGGKDNFCIIFDDMINNCDWEFIFFLSLSTFYSTT